MNSEFWASVVKFALLCGLGVAIAMIFLAIIYWLLTIPDRNKKS